MNDKTIAEVKREADRFLARLAEMKACTTHGSYGACPERAAVRRASMDLTRVLAKLRKS